ncbi:LysR family transcriptional regulator [uncultured Arcticibacterium sp.]|uniref:LysR family transcriptional regulator n=1 Tax=uncultured Arcticibacterium sp. TaxID=2173042 RepID=UPI0030F5D2C1
MINLEWLRTFGSIYECRNITEASKKLNMTQPGVSKHLAALESHIGKKLFERTTRKLAPTEYGKFLYAQINNPLQVLQKIEHYTNQRTKKERLAITIGCTSDFFKKELIHKIYHFDMYIVTHFGNEKELVEALESDKVQLLIGIKKHHIYEHEFSFFKQEELVLICSKNISIPVELLHEEKERIKWLQKQTWFAFDNEQADIKKYWKAEFNSVSKIVPRYILPSYLAIIDALKHSTGFSIAPKHLCQGIKQPFKAAATIEQKRFYAYKLKNSNTEAVKVFMEKMELKLN